VASRNGSSRLGTSPRSSWTSATSRLANYWIAL
jgi:hypothetical protein